MNASAPESVRFCQRCAADMQTVTYQNKPRRKCTACGFIHFVEPKIAVGGMLVDAGRLLLVKRVYNPEKGKWCLPAGYLDSGETPEAAVRREVLEETGLEVDVGPLEAVYADTSGQGAAVTLMYRVHCVGGELAAADDAADAAFFAMDAIPELAFDSTRDIVARLAREQSTDEEPPC